MNGKSALWQKHADFCGWHVDWNDANCNCGYVLSTPENTPDADVLAKARTIYVAGLLFSEDRSTLALIEKLKPAWQAGRFNAIGGKVELGETPAAAMRREFLEEAGLLIDNWEPVAKLSGLDFEVHFFASFGPVEAVRTMETERVTTSAVSSWLQDPQLIPNLRVIIPLALDDTGIRKPVRLDDVRMAA